MKLSIIQATRKLHGQGEARPSSRCKSHIFSASEDFTMGSPDLLRNGTNQSVERTLAKDPGPVHDQMISACPRRPVSALQSGISSASAAHIVPYALWMPSSVTVFQEHDPCGVPSYNYGETGDETVSKPRRVRFSAIWTMSERGSVTSQAGEDNVSFIPTILPVKSGESLENGP